MFTQYQYKIISEDKESALEKMNSLGADGWKVMTWQFYDGGAVRVCMVKKFTHYPDPTRGGGCP